MRNETGPYTLLGIDSRILLAYDCHGFRNSRKSELRRKIDKKGPAWPRFRNRNNTAPSISKQGMMGRNNMQGQGKVGRGQGGNGTGMSTE